MKKKPPEKRTKKKANARRQPRPSKKETPVQTNDDLFGFMKGRLEIVGDIESPFEDWKYWDPAKSLEK